MQTDSGESPYVPGPGENPLYTAEPLTLDDLKLLSDLFYLPYEHGPTARSMLQELDWLKTHSQTEQVMMEGCPHPRGAGGTLTGLPRSLRFMLAPDHSGFLPILLFYHLISLVIVSRAPPPRRRSGAAGRSTSIRCARRWCRCSTGCPTLPTAASSTTSTTTSATSRAGWGWRAPTSKRSVRGRVCPHPPSSTAHCQLHDAALFSSGGQESLVAQLMTDDPEPWGFRGGLSGEFQVSVAAP